MAKKVIYKVFYILNNIIMALRSLFWKRDKAIVLFGAWFGMKFADNSRFLFQYLAEHKQEFRLKHVVWVTRLPELCNMLREMGYEAYMIDSRESVYYHKKAGYHIVCNAVHTSEIVQGDILGEYSFGAVKINLWHGAAGVKGVAFGSNEYSEKKKAYPGMYWLKDTLLQYGWFRKFVVNRGGWGDCYYLSTSEAETEQLRCYFRVPGFNCIESFYPRNCPCPKLTLKEQAALDMISGFEKVILYLPTYRSGGNVFDFTLVAKKLTSVLKSKKILWVQKSHSADEGHLLSDSFADGIMELDSNFDINVLMPYITLLVTDYSSAMTDAAYHKKGILLYVPDYEEYMNGGNGFLEEAEEIMNGFGTKVYDIDSLASFIEKQIDSPDNLKPEAYAMMRRKYWSRARSLPEIWQDLVRGTSARRRGR